MILHHITKRAGRLIESSASLHSDRLGSGELYVIDISTIPGRLEDRVSESENYQVLGSLFSQIMVNAIDLIFVQN